jgi:hypothetical protein
MKLPYPLAATRAYVLARLYGPEEAPRARALFDGDPGPDPYGMAMAVLAAEQTGIAKEVAIQAKILDWVQRSRSALAQVATYTPSHDLFWGYPLQRMTLAAILGHAASFGDLDTAALADARGRFIDALATETEASPLDRATTLLHNLWLLERDAKAFAASKPPQISAASGFVSVTPRAGGFVATLPADVGAVRIGDFSGVATLSAQATVPLAALQPETRGMQIERRYYTLGPEGKAPLKDGEALAPGAHLYVELTLDAHADASPWRSAYYTVEDAVPAGFVPVEEDSEFRGAPYNLPLTHEALKRRTFASDSVRLWFEEPTWWQDSPRVTGYVLRAQFPGTYAVPPASVRDALAPAVGGRTGAATLTVAATTPTTGP